MWRLPRLDRHRPEDFPPTATALSEPNGLLCVGGDLSLPRLRAAYRRGIFPWYAPGEPILWWAPDPRALFVRFHVPRRLQRWLKRCDWQLYWDLDFAATMQACAAPRQGRAGTWITTEMLAAYTELHRAGDAHALTVHAADGRCLGGVYGVALGRVFFAESMYGRVDHASKIALLGLGALLFEAGYRLIDAQLPAPHLQAWGAECWPRSCFEARLRELVSAPTPPVWQSGPRAAREAIGALTHRTAVRDALPPDGF
jgi:leucyl/phenylalanyl-tRNA--protein transferase